jgi:presenilin-like A22 family membrane protease
VKTLSKFKTGPTHLAPILVSLSIGILCAFLISISSLDLYGVTPFPEDVSGSLGNACYFVALVGVGATFLYLLLKRRRHRIIALITGFVLTIAVFTLSLIYLSAAFSMFSIVYVDALSLVLSTLITALADLAIFRIGGVACNLIVLCLGGALGAFLGASVPTLSTVLILSFLAVYDVFAVYRGPVGKIARSGLDQLRGLSFSFKDIQMGLGDLTFYSMLTSRVFFDSGLLFSFASATGVLTGAFLALKMLEKRGVFPGLPFPVFLGLIPLVTPLFLL